MILLLSTVVSGTKYGVLGWGFVEVAYLGVTCATLGLAGLRLAQLVARARRLIETGYGHSAVRPALLSADGELDADDRTPSRRITAAQGALGAAATVGSLFLADASGALFPYIGFAGSIAIPTLMLRRLVTRRRGKEGWWSKLLRGKVGLGLFRFAAIGLRTRPAAMPAAGEPTSVALRSELTALFAALPSDQRAAFGDLPDLAGRLERQAELLRDRTPDPESDRRLQSVVAALELLRLDLLRLSAADADMDDLTRDLEQARRVSDDIEARLQAHDEMGRILSSDAP
jgi:hypothetical protein